MLPEHTKSVKLFCQIDASALAAVLLVLVVAMMFVQPTPHHGIGPDLPHVSHPVSMPSANREDAMVISVLRDGAVYFGRDKLLPEQLRSKILDRLKDRSVERKVYIRADGRVWHRTVKEVLAVVQSLGIEQTAILVDQRRPPTLAP
jgi:biopolymer transport protein TolR